MAEQQKRRPTFVAALCEGDFADEARKIGVTVRCAVSTRTPPKSRLARWIKTVGVIRRAVKEFKIDLIHCHSAPGNRYCYPASRLSGVPLVTHQRDTYAPDHFHAWVHRTDAIIAISEWARKNLPAALQEKTTVVHDAVTIPESSRIVWPKEEGGLVVGMAGRFVPEKGLDLLVDAAIAIAGSVDFRVEIWGFQPGQHVDLAEALKAKIRQARLEDRFHFEGYRLDMENFYRSIDIAVVPSRVSEGFGLTAAEGQAWGKAVIVAGHAGLAEIVDDENTGLKFTPHDANSLAVKLRRVLEDAKLRTAIAKAGRASSEVRFSPQAHADRIDNVYRAVLSRGKH